MDDTLKKLNEVVEEQKVLIEKVDALVEMNKTRKRLIAEQQGIIHQQNNVVKIKQTENLILVEISQMAIDIMKTYNPITGKYHKMIIQGEATVEDVKKCGNIMQKIIKMEKEFRQLIALYQNQQKKKTIGDNLNLSVINKGV